MRDDDLGDSERIVSTATATAPMQDLMRPDSGSRSEPHSLLHGRHRSKDRETIGSYGGYSDPGISRPGINDGFHARAW